MARQSHGSCGENSNTSAGLSFPSPFASTAANHAFGSSRGSARVSPPRRGRGRSGTRGGGGARDRSRTRGGKSARTSGDRPRATRTPPWGPRTGARSTPDTRRFPRRRGARGPRSGRAGAALARRAIPARRRRGATRIRVRGVAAPRGRAVAAPPARVRAVRPRRLGRRRGRGEGPDHAPRSPGAASVWARQQAENQTWLLTRRSPGPGADGGVDDDVVMAGRADL